MSGDDNENGGKTDPNGGGPEAAALVVPDIGAEAGAQTGGRPALEVLMNEAMEHHRFSRFEQAAEGYWKVLEADPEQPKATYYLGMVMHRVGENEKSAELVARALASGYGGAQEYCNLGNAYRDLGQSEAAIEALQTAVTLKSDFPQAYNNLETPLKMPSGALNRLESGRRDTGIRGTSDGPNGLF